MIYDPWRGKLLGFVYVYGSYIWIYVSCRKWRSYDYCVNCDNVERFVSLTLTHDLLWIVYDYANDVVLIERLFSWKHYEGYSHENTMNVMWKDFLHEYDI